MTTREDRESACAALYPLNPMTPWIESGNANDLAWDDRHSLPAVAEAIAKVRAEERERCAKEAESLGRELPVHRMSADRIASAIRRLT